MSIAKLLKSIVIFIVFIFLVLAMGLLGLASYDRAIDYKVSTEGIIIPAFDERMINFFPTYDKTKTLPFTAEAIIDIDGDGIEEIFLGSGINQKNAFY